MVALRVPRSSQLCTMFVFSVLSRKFQRLAKTFHIATPRAKQVPRRQTIW